MAESSAARWSARLSLPVPIASVAETGSTNADVRRLADDGAPHGTALLADRQTAGRGRLGRTWEAPPGSAVLLSVLLRPTVPPRDVPLLCLGAAVVVAEVCGPALSIKWPNDVLAPGGRKVAGILAELELAGRDVRYVVVGIGVNVTAAPPLDGDERGNRAACLADLGEPPEREALAALIVRGVLDVAEQVARDPEHVLARWRARSDTLGRRVRIGEIEGIAVDVDASGALLVRGDDGQVRRVLAGDVRMIG